jgi:hypothetical protein
MTVLCVLFGRLGIRTGSRGLVGAMTPIQRARARNRVAPLICPKAGRRG